MQIERAASAVWKWKRDSKAERAASKKRLRLAGALQGSVGLAVGAAVAFFGQRSIGILIAGIGSLIGLVALISPGGAYARLKQLLEAFGRGVGRLVAWVLLTPFFYLVLTPFGLLFKRGRRDPLERALQPDEQTYWIDRAPQPLRPEDYEKQF